MTKTPLISAAILVAGLIIAGFTLNSSNNTQSGENSTQSGESAVGYATVTSEETSNNQPTPASAQGTAGPMDKMAQQLSERLQLQPDDVEGWVLLGRTYQFMGKQDEAEKAYQRASELGFDQNQLDVIKRNMQKDQQEAKPTRLLPEPKPSKNLTAVMINQAIKNGEKSDQGVEITGSVSISKELQSQINKGSATLFIFARSEQGPPRPIAAIKESSPTFPFTFKMNDSHSLMGDQKLSSSAKVIIGARLSFSGNASPMQGDLEGFSTLIDTDTTSPVNIKIDQIRQ